MRPSITAEPTGKILAFVGLCILPTLCIGSGHVLSHAAFPTDGILHFVPQHGNPRTKSVRAEYEVTSLRNIFRTTSCRRTKACYTCHTDYTMYGPLKDKLKGLRYLYMEYVSTPPKTIHLDGHVQQPAVPALPYGHAQL